MRPAFFFIIFLVASFLCVAQTEPVSGAKYLDHGRFDATFTRNSPGAIIPETYFVLTFDPALSALTLAPEMIKAYGEIRSFIKDVPIYIIYKNPGVVSRNPGDEDRYFKELFYIDRSSDPNVFFRQESSLYDSLNVQSLMTKWFYVYHHRLVGGSTSIKLHALSDYNYAFPRDIIHIGEPKKIKIQQENYRLCTPRDRIKPYAPGKLLYITNINNTVMVLNTSTGVFEKSFDKKSVKPFDFFCNYMARKEEDCQFAKTHKTMDYNRDPNFFSGAVYSDQSVYVSTCFEMSLPWESSMYAGLKYITYVNELGEKARAKYDVVGESFPAILKLDTNLKLTDVFYVDINSYPIENRVPAYASFWGGLDKGFYIKDSILIIDNNPDASEPFRKIPKKADHAYSVFKLQKNKTFRFDHFLPLSYDVNYPKYMDWHNHTYFFQVRNNTYGHIMYGGYINELTEPNRTVRLSGTGDPLIPESMPAFAEDTARLIANYRTLCANSILDNRCAAVVYYYQNKLCVEFLKQDKLTNKLVPVQVNDLSRLEGLSTIETDKMGRANGDGLCISNDKLYLTRFENGEYYLYEYPFIYYGKSSQQGTETTRK